MDIDVILSAIERLGAISNASGLTGLLYLGGLIVLLDRIKDLIKPSGRGTP